MKVQYFVDVADVTRGLPMAMQSTPQTCTLQTMSRIIRRAASRGAGDVDAYKGDPDVGLLAHLNGRPC